MTKNLADKINKVSCELISLKKTAFIEDRLSSDNSNKMVYGFGRTKKPKRCLIIDPKKPWPSYLP